MGLRLVNLPGYSPDFNADEAIWGWAREEATGNLCLGSRAAVQERVGSFLAGLTRRKDEVRRRCRTVLQARAESLLRDSRPDPRLPANAHPTLALVQADGLQAPFVRDLGGGDLDGGKFQVHCDALARCPAHQVIPNIPLCCVFGI